MFRTLLSNLVVLALLAAPVNASAEAPQTLAGAVARAAEAHRNVDSKKSATFQPTRRSRPAPPKPRRGRAMLVGFLVGSALGGTIVYREYGPEGIWYGVYTMGIPCALAGLAVSR